MTHECSLVHIQTKLRSVHEQKVRSLVPISVMECDMQFEGDQSRQLIHIQRWRVLMQFEGDQRCCLQGAFESPGLSVNHPFLIHKRDSDLADLEWNTPNCIFNYFPNPAQISTILKGRYHSILTSGSCSTPKQRVLSNFGGIY